MTESLTKFQQLLRELFQFDCADLDFGIYQIMNYKRREVERFISEDLPRDVAQALEHGALAEQAQASQELQGVTAQIRETLGADALSVAGELAAAYHSTPLGKKYLELKAKTAGARGRDALEALIYNHLFAFFSHYYQDGDFISKRRYSTRQERYAIPYNGEEVTLYWANHDQYYVKTAEHFTDYTFTAPNGVTVHFKLQAADVEQNNVKGEKRFFIPRPAETLWDGDTAQLVIPFEFRPLTGQESITYGGKNQQEAILARALADIPRRLSPVTAAAALAALTAEKRVTAGGEPVTYLEHHLRQYVRRNTSDFFIHKDLKGFLTRELDFYLKNEVLSLDEMEAAGEGRAEGWFQIMAAIRAVGGRIIEFLAQVEEFQKMLWEKRKFITETFYCVTVGSMTPDFYPDIVVCDAQWEEWRTLFHIDEEQGDLFGSDDDVYERRDVFLSAHPTLVVDTRHFDQDFADRLLGSFDGLDEVTDGLLVHGENWQGLSLLGEKYGDEVKCVYIDPPYNTAASEILYKNNYKHSSWLSLIQDRIDLAHHMLTDDGALCIAIDDAEYARLYLALLNVFGEDRHLATVAIRSKPQGRAMAVGFSPNHEYAVFFANSSKTSAGRLLRDENRLGRYPERDGYGIFAWSNFRGTGAHSFRKDRPKLFYPVWIEREKGNITIPTLEWCSSEVSWKTTVPLPPGHEVLLPIDEEGTERVWTWGWERAQKYIATDLMAKQVHGKWQVYRKYRPNQEGVLPGTWWGESKYSASESGTQILQDTIGEGGQFSYPKSVFTVEDCIRSAGTEVGDFVLDYFAGSGTTGHAVINLNRSDGGRRHFILVEMAGYFDTVLLPRIKKVTYTPEWKDGKPRRAATAEEAERGPRIVKIIRLESYEDSLNNIVFDDAAGQSAMQFDDYLLRYMLKWEARKSETLLDVEKLASPFRYTLHIHADGQTAAKPVDIPETFAYLLGLHVQMRRAYNNGDRRYLVYRGTVDQRQVAVIWRETEGWTQADYERDRQFVAEQKLAEGADELFVNGDSFIPGARALEPIFKARMFAPVEA